MATPTLQALIFDVDGTLADTEELHRQAFNRAFADMGLDWSWDAELYSELLHMSGGRERLSMYWQRMHPEVRSIDSGAVRDTLDRIHELKAAYYSSALEDGELDLRPGVMELMDEAAAAGVQLALVTTSSPVHLAALMRRALGPAWRHSFVAIGDASSVTYKKPHPQVYQQVLQSMQLDPSCGLAFEDSGNGLTAATLAGLATVVTPAQYTQKHEFERALKVLPDLAGVKLSDLRAWHQAHWSGERLMALEI
jgi:HAD superfamily hydrolase (TIGR01509 family)